MISKKAIKPVTFGQMITLKLFNEVIIQFIELQVLFFGVCSKYVDNARVISYSSVSMYCL